MVSTKIRILGCGPSGGVPLVTGNWGACDPANPKNYRTRSSILVELFSAPPLCTTTKMTSVIDHRLLIDTSPDLRQQLLAANVQSIDAVLFTHEHADHSHGIDEVRQLYFSSKKTIALYGNQSTVDLLHQRFSYLFQAHLSPDKHLYPVIFQPHVVEGTFWIDKIPIVAFSQDHGYSTTLGYRFGKFAYSTDVKNLSNAALKVLEGVEVWIVDCLSYKPSETHSYLEKTLEWIKHVNPKRAILTHMNQSLDYETLCKTLPPGVEPAYDGLEIIIE